MIDATDGALLTAFAAVVRRGPSSAAAREIKLSKSVISLRIGQLEERCCVRLLGCTTRRLRLTHAGIEVLETRHTSRMRSQGLSRSLDTGRSGRPGHSAYQRPSTSVRCWSHPPLRAS